MHRRIGSHDRLHRPISAGRNSLGRERYPVGRCLLAFRGGQSRRRLRGTRSKRPRGFIPRGRCFRADLGTPSDLPGRRGHRFGGNPLLRSRFRLGWHRERTDESGGNLRPLGSPRGRLALRASGRDVDEGRHLRRGGTPLRIRRSGLRPGRMVQGPKWRMVCVDRERRAHRLVPRGRFVVPPR